MKPIGALAGVLFLCGAALAQPHTPAASPGVGARGETEVHAPDGEPAAGHGREHQVIEFDAATAVWVLVIFLVLLAVLYPTAWKGVLAGLKAREGRIRQDIAEAEKTRLAAQQTLAQYNQQLAQAEERVRQLIAQASADGERIAGGIRLHAQQEGQEIKEKAQQEIEAAKNQAIGEIYRQAAELATSAAEKILRRNLNVEDQRELVNASVEQMRQMRSLKN